MNRKSLNFVGDCAYCQRCNELTPTLTRSAFDSALMCEECAKRERQHPSFIFANETIWAEHNGGNFDFKGIGLPDDLKKD